MATSKDNNQRFITSLRDEPKKMLLPIAGYEKAIVKSLDDACEPIEHLFDEYLNTHITIAKTNSTSPEDGLTPDESASIHLYTLEWPVHENSFYMVLNDTLRATDRNKLKPWFKYLKLVLTAFHKLPPSGHTLIWRGVREDLSADYPKDRKFTWWAFSSCTATMKVLESDNYLGKSGSRTIFSIETKSGKSIAAHSYFGNEDEVLLPPGVYFTVVSVLNPADDLHIIQIREIPAPYKSIADPFDLSKKREPLPEPIKPPMKLERSQERIVIPTPPIRREISPIRNSLAKPYVRSVERVVRYRILELIYDGYISTIIGYLITSSVNNLCFDANRIVELKFWSLNIHDSYDLQDMTSMKAIRHNKQRSVYSDTNDENQLYPDLLKEKPFSYGLRETDEPVILKNYYKKQDTDVQSHVRARIPTKTNEDSTLIDEKSLVEKKNSGITLYAGITIMVALIVFAFYFWFGY